MFDALNILYVTPELGQSASDTKIIDNHQWVNIATCTVAPNNVTNSLRNAKDIEINKLNTLSILTVSWIDKQHNSFFDPISKPSFKTLAGKS